MKKLTALLIMALLTLVAAQFAYACTAFYQSESIDGLHKICYYDHLGDTVAYTFRNVDICPRSVQVKH